jgi:hypothetical protein
MNCEVSIIQLVEELLPLIEQLHAHIPQAAVDSEIQERLERIKALLEEAKAGRAEA